MKTESRSDPLAADDRWFVRAAAWFRPTPAETVGLAVLLFGALLATALLWWSATNRPALLPAVAGGSTPPAASAPSSIDEGGGASRHRSVPPPSSVVDPPRSGAARGSELLTVHVTGAVAHPGLVTVEEGARVGNAVALAGGLDADALVERVNLARELSDGEHVHVPRMGEPISPTPPSAPAGVGAVTQEPRAERPLDLNRATVAELERLPGIGPARSRAIVAHREEHGPFEVPGDLRAVTGIGERTFQSLAELVTVR